jgi:hypothetical protein
MVRRVLGSILVLSFIAVLGCAQQETQPDEGQEGEQPAEAPEDAQQQDGAMEADEGMEAEPQEDTDAEPMDEPMSPEEAGAGIGIGEDPEMGGGDTGFQE